jgi:uncharacterized membrane protein YeiH
VLRNIRPGVTTLALAVAAIFCIRAAAIRWHVEMPAWLTSRHPE